MKDGLIITAIIVAIVGGIAAFILAIPWMVASVAASEYKAHSWYCGASNGYMHHRTDQEVKDSANGFVEVCRYNQ